MLQIVLDRDRSSIYYTLGLELTTPKLYRSLTKKLTLLVHVGDGDPTESLMRGCRPTAPDHDLGIETLNIDSLDGPSWEPPALEAEERLLMMVGIEGHDVEMFSKGVTQRQKEAEENIFQKLVIV